MRWPTYEEASGTVFGVAAVAFAIWLVQAPETRLRPIIKAFTPGPPIEQPATVQASVAKLRTSPLLVAMDANPSSCSRVPKGFPRYRCFYRAGDMEIVVSWHKNSGRFSAFIIQKTEPLGSVSFAWSGLAETITLLCGGIDIDQANAIVRDVPDRLSMATWTDLKGERVTADTAGAHRRTRVVPRADCEFLFYEIARGETVERHLIASPISPEAAR